MKCLYRPKPCSRCGTVIKVGQDCVYESETKTVRCIECPKKVSGSPTHSDSGATHGTNSTVENWEATGICGHCLQPIRWTSNTEPILHQDGTEYGMCPQAIAARSKP
jgi:hypothetical protein